MPALHSKEKKHAHLVIGLLVLLLCFLHLDGVDLDPVQLFTEALVHVEDVPIVHVPSLWLLI